MRHSRADYQRIQDPFNLIPYNEPVFLIRGQDLAAPGTLDDYADRAESLGASEEMVQSVREHAESMRRWQQDHVEGKVPDAPEGAL